MAGTLFFDEKIRRAALFWFGLQDDGILQIFYSRAIQRIIVDSPAFWRPGWGKDLSLYTFKPSAEEIGEFEVVLYETAQNFELFSNIQDKKITKLKNL